MTPVTRKRRPLADHARASGLKGRGGEGINNKECKSFPFVI